MDVSCNLTTFKFFVRVPPGLYCHPIERAYCQVKPERIETHTGGVPGAGSGLRVLLRPGGPRPNPEGAGRARGRGFPQPPGRDNRHRFPRELQPLKPSRPRRSPAREWRWGSPGPGYPPDKGLFAPSKHSTPPSAATARASSAPAPVPPLRAGGDLPGMPAVLPASLPCRFSFNPENESLPSNLHPTSDPSTSEPSPACLPSPSPSLTFGASGLVSRAGKEKGVEGLLLFSVFIPLSRLPAPSAWKRGCELEKGCATCRKVLFQEKKAEREVLGTNSHVSPHVTYENCPFLPFLGSRGGVGGRLRYL